MKIRIFFTLIAAIVVFSSCSGKRFGRVPKVKKNRQETAIKHPKKRVKKETVLIPQKTTPAIAEVSIEPKIITETKQTVSVAKAKSPTRTIESKTAAADTPEIIIIDKSNYPPKDIENKKSFRDWWDEHPSVRTVVRGLLTMIIIAGVIALLVLLASASAGNGILIGVAATLIIGLFVLVAGMLSILGRVFDWWNHH